MTRHAVLRRALCAAAVLCASLAGGAAAPSAARAAEEDLWPGLRQEIFGQREIAEDDGFVTLYAPERAEDAALVPLSVRVSGAATFTFGEAFRAGDDIGERQLATRIRLDSFSKVRAVLETADGRLHMSSRFVSGAEAARRRRRRTSRRRSPASARSTSGRGASPRAARRSARRRS